MNNLRQVADSPEQDPRDIAEWARRYAQNRALPFLLSMTFFSFFLLAIAVLSRLAGGAYGANNMILLWVCLSGLIGLGGGLLYFSVPQWGGGLMRRLGQRLYGREGTVELTVAKKSGRWKRWDFAVVIAFLGCVQASVLLGLYGYMPLELMQPVSALYVVPFLLFLFLCLRPAIGPVMLLWPFLYCLHGLLIVVGAPVVFSGSWQSLNMLIPTIGYGSLSGLTSHLYSRALLRRLKKLARVS